MPKIQRIFGGVVLRKIAGFAAPSARWLRLRSATRRVIERTGDLAYGCVINHPVVNSVGIFAIPPMDGNGKQPVRDDEGVYTWAGQVASSHLTHHSTATTIPPRHSNPKIPRQKTVEKIPLSWRGAENSRNFGGVV